MNVANVIKNLADYLEELEKINNEMKFHDPYKWLTRFEEIEEISETIENLESEIARLEDAKRLTHLLSTKEEHETFLKRADNRIEYLTECITILQDTHNDIIEGGDSE